MRSALLHPAGLAPAKEFVNGAVEQVGQSRQDSAGWTPRPVLPHGYCAGALELQDVGKFRLSKPLGFPDFF